MKRYLGVTICFVLCVLLFASSVSLASDTITLNAGIYNVGKDIPAGEYEILCTEASDPYNDYLDLMKSLSKDDENLQALWELYGGLTDEPTVSVTIRGASGEKKKSFTLEKNAKRTITLEENYSIKIEEGTCTLEAKSENGSVKTNNDTSRAALEWTCPGCGNYSTGNFCSNCGTARPKEDQNNIASSENEDIVGTWLATHFTYNGVKIDISNYDMSVTMQLSADGSATIITEDGEERGTWTRNENRFTVSTDESGLLSGTIENGEIILTDKNDSMFFSREMAQGSDSLPSPVSATSEDEFLGTWNMSRFSTHGVILTPIELTTMGYDVDMTLTISPGEARADIVANGQREKNRFATTFSNGRLQFKSTVNSVAFSAVLTDSGEIFITINNDGVASQYYLSKEETESFTASPTSTPEPELYDKSEDISNLNGKTAHLEPGKYIGGDDIPTGKYILKCKTDTMSSGLVWVAADTDNLDSEYPSILYEYVGSNEERNYYINIGKEYILNCPFACDLAYVTTISFESGSAQIETGTYIFGDDLPTGKYTLVCKTGKNDSGIVWLAKDTDNLNSNYPSVLYEYVSDNETKKYYLNARDNYILYCPFPCTLIETNTLSFKNDSITIEPGQYVFGDDLPSGKYMLTCNTTTQDSGIVWIAKDTDNLNQVYPSVLYEYVSDNDQSKFSINVKDGYILNCPFGCTLTKTQGASFN